MNNRNRSLDIFQQVATGVMALMILITFIAANVHAILWQSSEWLVSTVLPAVVVDLTNDQRAENNAAPLRRNATLDAAAQLKAQHMVENEYFEHYSPDGISPWHWFDEAGYVYAHAGENLAIHFTDSEEVVQAWMDSPTHRDNIVANKFTEIGVGTAKGTYEGYDTVYVVQLFGAPALFSAPTAVPVSAPDVPVEIASDTAFEPETEPAIISTGSTSFAEVVEDRVIAGSELVAAEESTATLNLDNEAVIELPKTSAPDEAIDTQYALNDADTVTTTPTSTVLAQEMSQPAPRTDEYEPVPDVEQYMLENAGRPHFNEVVMLESPTISTSSGLAVAQIESGQPHAGYTFAAIATQPNRLLEFMYITLGVVALLLISTSIFIEVRRMQYRQVVYGVAMLFVMSGLWFFHAWLTGGAVIV